MMGLKFRGQPADRPAAELPQRKKSSTAGFFDPARPDHLQKPPTDEFYDPHLPRPPDQPQEPSMDGFFDPNAAGPPEKPPMDEFFDLTRPRPVRHHPARPPAGPTQVVRASSATSRPCPAEA